MSVYVYRCVLKLGTKNIRLSVLKNLTSSRYCECSLALLVLIIGRINTCCQRGSSRSAHRTYRECCLALLHHLKQRDGFEALRTELLLVCLRAHIYIERGREEGGGGGGG